MGWRLLPLVLADRCWLVSLVLRHGRDPVDLVPSFSSDIFSYQVTLNFAMDVFEVDGRASTGCNVEGAPAHPVPLAIGRSTQLPLYALSPDTGERQQYIVKVNRLLGSETDLQSLRIHNAAFLRVFDPTVPRYDATLSSLSDEIDLSPTIPKAVNHNAPVTTPAPSKTAQNTTNASSASADKSRRLSSRALRRALFARSRRLSSARRERRLAEHGNQHSGEQQFPEQFAKFLLDPGFTRMITITVQAADPTQAGIGTYVVRVKREGCPPGRPFFDPVKRLCVQNCNEGTYPDKDRHRCARCNDNCHVCSDFSDCRMCLPDST